MYLIATLVCLVLLLCLFTGIRVWKLHQTWGFLVGRDAINESTWFQEFANKLSVEQQFSLKFFLAGLCESTNFEWTRFRPEDLVGPNLFGSFLLDPEPSWALFSDLLLLQNPQLFELFDEKFTQSPDGVRIGDLIAYLEDNPANKQE